MPHFMVNWNDADGFWAEEFVDSMDDAKLIVHVRKLTQRNCVICIIDQHTGNQF
jgi:hypothetical protein